MEYGKRTRQQMYVPTNTKMKYFKQSRI